MAEEKPTSTSSATVVEKPTVQVSASTPVQEYSASAVAESAEHLQPVQAVKGSMDQVDASTSAVTPEEPTSQLSPQEAPESLPSSMTQSTLIRMEANAIAAHISQSMDASSQSISNGLEHVGSLSSSLINGAESLVMENGTVARLPASPTLNRKLDGRHNATAKGRSINGNVLLKQALSSNILTSTESLTGSCLSTIDNIKPPANMDSTADMSCSTTKMDSSSSLKLACSVLDESYFDDEQRREGLLQELALLEQTVDENANTDSVGSNDSSPSSGQRKKLTPRARRQAEKDRYQTYTLNANEIEIAANMEFYTEKDIENGQVPVEYTAESADTKENQVQNSGRTARQRRSDDRERFRTQTISTVPPNGREDYVEKSETESVEKNALDMAPVRRASATLSVSDPADLSILEMDAKVVIRTLTEQEKRSRKNSDSSELISEECLLDCETLSLVSNESESDR